jgi:putative pyruvate formate lyase activating enzyme
MNVGDPTDSSELADTMLHLEKRGAHNINFVTPSHVVPAILNALVTALERGLKIPLVYNSSGYDSLEELSLLDGVIDIYMPDAKYSDNVIAKRLSGADNYVESNRAALKEMHRQVGVLELDDEGVARRGLLIRHLVLPEDYAGTEDIMRFIAEELAPETYISLMSQYFPANKTALYPDVDRPVSREEYRRALRAMERYGLHQGFIQGT